MPSFGTQSKNPVSLSSLVGNTAQSIADAVNGTGNSSSGNSGNSGNSANVQGVDGVLRGILLGINKLVDRLAPPQRIARIPIQSLGVGAAVPTNNAAFQNVNYNYITGTCRGLGATLDVYLNAPSPTGSPDFQFIGGAGSAQFFFPSMPITQLTIVNSGVAVAQGNVDLGQY